MSKIASNHRSRKNNRTNTTVAGAVGSHLEMSWGVLLPEVLVILPSLASNIKTWVMCDAEGSSIYRGGDKNIVNDLDDRLAGSGVRRQDGCSAVGCGYNLNSGALLLHLRSNSTSAGC